MSTSESHSHAPERALAWHRCAGLALACLALLEGAVLRSAPGAIVAAALAWTAWTSEEEARIARALIRTAHGDGPKSAAAKRTVALGIATFAATPPLLASAYHFATSRGAEISEIGSLILATLGTIALKGMAALAVTAAIRRVPTRTRRRRKLIGTQRE